MHNTQNTSKFINHGNTRVERRQEIFPGTNRTLYVRIIKHPLGDNISENVKVWEIGRHFLLFTHETSRADHLLISSHGYYFPWTGTTQVGPDETLDFLTGHGYQLPDPTLARMHVPSGNRIFSRITLDHSQSMSSNTAQPQMLLAGTERRGHVRNYALSKFQDEFVSNRESYHHIAAHVVKNHIKHANNNTVPKRDVLTVRNRRFQKNPTLEDLLSELRKCGIRYQIIECSFCRNNYIPDISNDFSCGGDFDDEED